MTWPQIQNIKQAVCRHYRLPAQAMTWPMRSHDTSHPRQVAIYLVRKRVGIRSLTAIGMDFGGRDRKTVYHAIKAVEARRSSDPKIDADIRAIEADLQRSAPCPQS